MALVNDGPQSLDRCSGGPGESCSEGELVGWLEGRAEVGDFRRTTCGVGYGNSTDMLGIYNM